MQKTLNLFQTILDNKKSIPPKGGTQRENDDKEQLNSIANVAKSNGDTEIIEEEKTSGERYDKETEAERLKWLVRTTDSIRLLQFVRRRTMRLAEETDNEEYLQISSQSNRKYK